jgi:hypothetical protein
MTKLAGVYAAITANGAHGLPAKSSAHSMTRSALTSEASGV